MLQVDLPEDPRELTRSLIETVLVEMNDRLLGVVFWFFLLGPAGALAFRLSSILKARFRQETSGFGAAAARVHHWLSWAPARLTAVSYALMGNFTESVRYRREEAHRWTEENRGILVASGLGALQYPLDAEHAPVSRMNDIADLRSTIELLRRVIVVWVIGLGALTVIGASVSWILG
jgi:adenosylcobinamide-phosphate synthase